MKKITPEFENLSSADTFTNHVAKLTGLPAPTPHDRILNQLLEQIEPIDYEAQVYPHLIKLRDQATKNGLETEPEKEAKHLKLKTKHLLIITIEALIKCAEDNNWGLCINNGMIYAFNGAYWAPIEEGAFQKFLGDAAGRMGINKYSAKHYQFQEQLLKQFYASGYLKNIEQSIDIVCINLQNSTYVIQNGIGKLRPFDKKDFLTYQLPFEYNPSAEAPLFKKYLDEVLPDIDSQKVLGEYTGYVFIKNGNKVLKIEKVLVLYGSGANGKSVFFEVLNALLGRENVINHPLHRLTDETGYYRADLVNKLVNYASEINGRMETAMFKQMASGEPIGARLPYGRPLMLHQYAKLIFNCNELPWERESTNAFFRRFLIIPFPITIPEERQDKNLHTKIIDQELSGVFNWVLDGLGRLIEQQGFTKCLAAEATLQKYEEESDSVMQFIEEGGYEKEIKESVLLKDLYIGYKHYCTEEDNYKPIKKSKFRSRLESIGIRIEKINKGNVVYIKKNKK